MNSLCGCQFSWKCRQQKNVCLYSRSYSSELDFSAANDCCSLHNQSRLLCCYGASKEMIWQQIFLKELGKKQEDNVLYWDIQSAIHLVKNPSFNSRTKHIQVQYYFIPSLLENYILKLESISGTQNLANMLIEAATIEKLKLYSASVGLQE